MAKQSTRLKNKVDKKQHNALWMLMLTATAPFRLRANIADCAALSVDKYSTRRQPIAFQVHTFNASFGGRLR